MTTPMNNDAPALDGDAVPVARSRRGFLKRVGVTGLMTSGAVFAGAVTAEQASAAPACCNLAHYPANTTYSYCYSHAQYIWYCTDVGGYLHCACCETAGYAKSAASCQYN